MGHSTSATVHTHLQQGCEEPGYQAQHTNTKALPSLVTMQPSSYLVAGYKDSPEPDIAGVMAPAGHPLTRSHSIMNT